MEHNVGKVKNKGRETALKESLKEDLSKEFEEYSFEDDPGSNNSGYYELQARFTLSFIVSSAKHSKCSKLLDACQFYK